MTTYSGSATLIQAEREIVASIAYSSDRYPGFDSCQGTFSTGDRGRLSSGIATLRLDDGSQGEIRIVPLGSHGVFHAGPS
jgi:hypothetical protein